MTNLWAQSNKKFRSINKYFLCFFGKKNDVYKKKCIFVADTNTLNG